MSSLHRYAVHDGNEAQAISDATSQSRRARLLRCSTTITRERRRLLLADAADREVPEHRERVRVALIVVRAVPQVDLVRHGALERDRGHDVVEAGAEDVEVVDAAVVLHGAPVDTRPKRRHRLAVLLERDREEGADLAFELTADGQRQRNRRG